MRTLTRKERLTGQIGVSLLAGMFSMVPVAFGMPVYDATYAANSKGVAITKPEANRMDVTGSTAGGHYVAAWTDFSVAQGEKVTFDGGAIGQSDYLNLVTGQATSDIAGTIQGGRNVYLVNPNGVIFGEKASVNVGNLYVSTQKIDTVNASDFADSNSSSPLGDTATGNADVVNLGTIKADKLTIVGNNVSLQNSAKIYKSNSDTDVNTNVTIQAAGYIHVGHDDDGPWTDAATTQDAYTAQYDAKNKTITNYQLVDNVTDLGNMTTGGNYMLAKTVSNVSGEPLSHQHIKKDAPFTGNFDGMYHEIQNVPMTGGLFPAAKDANIENVGVVKSTVTPGSYDVPYDKKTSSSAVSAAGAIVGYATGKNRLHNVYSENVTMQDSSAINGGLVGIAGVGTLSISESYNTSQVKGDGQQHKRLGQMGNNYGGGIVGYVVGEKNSANGHATVNLTDVYNTGTTDYGMVGGIANVNELVGVNVKTSYSTNAGQGTLGPTGLVADSYSGIKTSKAVKDYNGFDISNKGGAGKKWRIYEGRTTPLLTDFFKGTATVNLNKDNVSNAAQITTASGGLKNSTTLASTLHFDKSGKVSKTYDARTINLSLSEGDVSSNAYSTVETAPAGKAEGTYVMAYTGQHGYDLVGGEAEIEQRPVYLGTINGKEMLISKTYDGRATFKGSATDLLTASAGETGLVQGDDVTMPGSVEGNFYDNNGTNRHEAPDVGTGKYVELTFTELGSELKGDARGNYKLNMDPSLKEAGDTVTINTIKGAIIPRALNVRLNQSKDIDKTYDGTGAVLKKDAQGNTTAATKPYEAKLYDATNGTGGNIVFDDHVAQNISADSTGYINSQHQQALQLQFNPADPTYRDASGTANANASKTKNDRYIDYTGLKLGVKEAGETLTTAQETLRNNYYLTDGTSVIYYGGETLKDEDYGVTFLEKTNADKGGKLTATGTIARRVIDTSGIQITGTSSTKTYDGGSKVGGVDSATVTVNDTANILADDVGKITFSVTGGSFVDSTKTHAAVNATYSGIADSKANGYKAKHISYDVKVSSDYANVLNNYTFVTGGVGTNEDATAKLTALNEENVYNGFFQDGTITRRTINVSLPDNVKDINKDYDGNTDVVTAVDYKSYVGYTDPDDTSSGVFAQDKDNDKLFTNSNATYDSPDVTWVNGRNQNTNTITYTAGLTGIKAGNYQLYDAVSNVTKNADVEGGLQLGRKATGTISPRTVSIQGVSKVYDGSKDVTGASVISLSGTLDRDAGLVAVGAGSGSAYADKNVGAGKNVSLVGLALSGNRAGNYALDSSSYTGNVGTITPRTISTSDVSLVDGNGQTIAPTKAYDGTKGYSVPAGATLKSASILNEDDVSFAIVDADFNDLNATDYVRPSQDFPSPGAHWVRYAVQAQGADAKNYSFVNGATVDQGLKTDGTTYGKSASGDYDASAFWTSGTITPRTIKLAIKDGAIEKTYDGTANVLANDNGSATHYLQFNAGDGVTATDTYNENGYLIYGTDDAAHKFLANDLNDTDPRVSLNISNVQYDDKNVLRDADNNVISGKQVSYTVSLDGDYKGNYQLETNSTAVRTSWEGDGAGYTYTYTKNNGRINPREVQAVFSNVDKIYNGTAKVEVPDGYALTGGNVTFLRNGETDTVANGELDQISFNKNALTGDYTDGKNVKVEDGKAAAKGITFDEGAVEKAFVNAGNYTVTDAGTSKGTILPRPVGTLVLKKDGVQVDSVESKTYDGSDIYEGTAFNDPSANYSIESSNSESGAGIIPGDNVILTPGSGAAHYADANGEKTANATGYDGTGTGGAQKVLYAVHVDGTGASNYTLGKAGSLTPLVAGTNYGDAASVGGNIDRRVLYVGLGQDTGIDKTYDGSASVGNQDSAQITFGGNYIKYTGASMSDPDHQLVSGDGAAWDISALYQPVTGTNVSGEDVYRDANGNPSVKNITYTVSLTGDAAGNYRLNGNGGTKADPVAHETFNATGMITPKTVNIVFANPDAGITKVYDGTTDITTDHLKASTEVVGKVTYPATETTPETADDVYAVYAAVSEDGKLAYSDKNVGVYGPDPDDAGEIVLNGGTILLGGTDAGNYALGTVSDLKGTITARTLYVDFKGDGTGIDKVYNQNTEVLDEHKGDFVGFVDANEEDHSGLITADVDKVGLTYNASYTGDANVARDAEGKVLTRQVWYQNFALTGDEAGNYEWQLVEKSAAGINSDTTDSDKSKHILKGTGTIKPIEAEISLKEKVRKTYDGTNTVPNAYKAIENINRTMLDEKLLLTGDTVNLALQTDVDGGARYTSKDAGPRVGVDYFLTWDNQNYELVPVPTSDGLGVLTTKYDRDTQTVYATYTSRNGIIDPAKIRGLVATPAEKTYDGKDRLMGSDAGAFIQSKYLEDVFYDEDLDITANGVYRGGIDADTGISYSGATASLTEASTDPISHAVSYTNVKIGNPNYYLEGVDTYDTNTGDINRGSIELEGSGIIRRAEVTVTATDATTTKGVWPSSYSGSWSGAVEGDADFDANDFTFDVTREAVDINTAGTYPDAVTGWFRNKSGMTNLTSGNYGQNYYIKEFNPGNFIVNEPSSPSPGGGGSGGGSGGGGGGGSTPAGGGGSTPTGGGGGIPSILPPPGSNPTPGGEHGGAGENPGTGGNVEPGGPGTGPGGSGGSGTGPGGSSGSGGSGTGLDGISSNGSGVNWDTLLEPGGTANGEAASAIATTSAVLAESGSKKVTPDNTILVQVSESEGLAETANAAETPFSSASVAYKSTGVNAADLSGTGQIVGVSSNADVDSEIALESSAGSVSISNDSNTESTAELEYSDATVNITTKDGTKSSISLSTSEDGVNLSTGTRSDATTKTTASSSEQTETSSGISIRVQKDDTEEDTETGEENRSKKQDSSLIGLETLKDAVNLGAPMDTAV